MSLRLPCCCPPFQRIFHLSTGTQMCDQGQGNQKKIKELTLVWTPKLINFIFARLYAMTHLNRFTNSFSKSNTVNRWNHLAEWQKATFEADINKRGITRRSLNTNGPPPDRQISTAARYIDTMNPPHAPTLLDPF